MAADKNWGGKRPGAGRPATGKDRKRRSIYVSDEEYVEVKKLIEKMRGGARKSD